MGLSSPEKAAKRHEVLMREVGDHPLRKEAVPMIQEAFALWDEVRSTNEPWPLRDIERFARRCIEIAAPMEQFRKDNAIPHDEDTYQNVIVFTNKWHGNLLTEAMQPLRSNLQRELEMVAARADTLATEMRRYLGANVDDYVREGERYQSFKKTMWEIVEGFKEIERLNDLIDKADKQRIDTESTYKGAITRAMSTLNDLREDFFKHGDHYNSKRSATFLLWTVIISLLALALGVANFVLEVRRSSQIQKVEVQLQDSVEQLLNRGGMIRLPRQIDQ